MDSCSDVPNCVNKGVGIVGTSGATEARNGGSRLAAAKLKPRGRKVSFRPRNNSQVYDQNDYPMSAYFHRIALHFYESLTFGSILYYTPIVYVLLDTFCVTRTR